MADVTVRSSLVATPGNAVTGAGPIEGKIAQKLVAMLEFDLDGTLAADSYLTLIPAAQNPNGLIIMNVKGIVTELIASDATDGVITVRDGASSPNTIATLSCTDTDAVGDHVPPTGFTAQWESLLDGTDYSDQQVEAGVKVEAAITTAASDAGTVTGKVLVLVEFIQVPSLE